MNPILEQLINRLAFGSPINHRNLTIFPITYTGNGKGKIQYLTLDEAVEKQYIHITEVSQGGSVPDLTITNKSDRKILMLDGEEVIGAKQNRILNTTILVAENVTLTIPVSCVEAHRWHSVSPEFQSPGTHAHSHLRAKKAASVHQNLVASQQYFSDQAEVWDEVDSHLAKLQTPSPTAAMHDAYIHHSDKLDEYIKAFKYQPGQKGIAVAINNQFICVDIFDQTETMEKYWKKLLRSYAIDALANLRISDSEKQEITPQPDLNRINNELAEIRSAVLQSNFQSFKSVGLGDDIRIRGKNLVGATLVFDQTPIHFAVFRTESADNSEAISNFESPFRRRTKL